MISIGCLGLIILAIFIIALVVVLVLFIKNLLEMSKSLNKIIKDVNVISEVSQRRSPDVSGLVDDIKGSASSISAAIKGEESPEQSASSILKGVTSVISIIKDKRNAY